MMINILQTRLLLLLVIIIAISSSVTQALAVRYPVPKLVLLDRDGVINQDVRAPGITSKSQFRLHHDVGTAIANLKQRGCHVVVITNQSCVGKGLLDLKGLGEIHEDMQRLLLEENSDAILDQIYFCTAVDNDDPRKKPNPGMVLEACNDWKVEACETVFIGDTLTDMQAAKAGGVTNRILVQTGYGFGLMGKQQAPYPPMVVKSCDIVASQSQMTTVTPFAYARDLPAAVHWLLDETPSKQG